MAYTPKFQKLIDERRAALLTQMSPFASSDEIVLEIGCGHGHFLTAYAAAHPQRVCVGIDLIGERIQRATKKRDRARLPNLHFIQAEARLFLETLSAPQQIATIFVLFPDPWPKLRHNKHRIIQPAFLMQLARLSVAEAPLYFRTDFQPYYLAARDVIASDCSWVLSEESWPFEFETVFQRRADAFYSLTARCRNPVRDDNFVTTALKAD